MEEKYSIGNWIFPEYVCGNIKNENLKIRANVSDGYYISTYWTQGECITRGGDDLGILKGGNIYSIKVRTQNLFKIVQDLKQEDGLLPGTYKLSEVKKGIYDIVPEGIPEEIIKTGYSKIYNSKQFPFTKKMIPGHIYASRDKVTWVCIGSGLDYYSKISYKTYGRLFTFNLINYSDIPRKVKILIPIDFERDRKFKTIQELAQQYINDSQIYSDSYAGKDLGPYLSDDGRPWEDYILDNPNKKDMHGSWFFINELYRKDKDFHDILRKDDFLDIDYILNINPKAKIVYDI